MFGAGSELKQLRGRLPADYPMGMLLQMTSVNNKSGEKLSSDGHEHRDECPDDVAMSDYPSIGAGKKK